jgi:putative transposase
MARIGRIIVPGLPHHVTQRGNRQQKLFLGKGDYALYRDLLAERCKANGVSCWAYCLMPNHVHLILTPETETGLSRAVGEAHRRYTAFFNARARVTGHLFQGRFGCAAMDEAHLMNALRYLALNPVRAKLVERAEDWPHCSVPAHLAGKDDVLVDVAPALARAPRFADLLDLSAVDASFFADFEASGANGRPIGDSDFIDKIELELGRSVRPGRRGRKPAPRQDGDEIF